LSNRWIEHNGKSVLVTDFRGLRGEQLLSNLEELATIMTDNPIPVRLLLNAEGIFVDPTLLTYAKQLGKEVFAAKASKTAALGVRGAKATLLQFYNAFTGAQVQPFNSEREALDWLVE
jgi:hypothetical protein